MSPSEAIAELTKIGFRFRLIGEGVKVRYEGQETPDPAKVAFLLTFVKQHRVAVKNYLALKPQDKPERILSCSECPWFRENPWTHYPELPAWCEWHFDHLPADNPVCIGYRRGTIPPRNP